jgi:hypothetical protein
MAMLRFVTLILIGLAFLAYLVVFGQMSKDAVMLFFPFTMIPYFVIALLVMTWRSRGSQIVCLVTTLAYSAWFALVYLDATKWHPDPQSPIAFVFVSIYAAPMLFVLWLVAYAFEWNARSASSS